ncbi:GGDEF domain-containing protein [Pirellulaceae bacterium SH449]
MPLKPQVHGLDQDSEKPFQVAKVALSLIGKFGTPPTPEVYEVWYRYAAGESDAISEQLNYAINDLKEVSVDRLRGIREQFLPSSQLGEINHDITSRLDSLSLAMQRTIETKKKSIDNFESQLDEAYSTFKVVQPTEDLKSVLANLMRRTSDMNAQMSEMSLRLGESSVELAMLREQVNELRISAFTDPLTGVGNRRKFDREMEMVFGNVTDTNSTYLLMIDLDNFKSINDAFGHCFGDESLKHVARSIQEFFPDSVICRLGGDEFAAIANSSTEEAIETSQELCNYLTRNSDFADGRSEISPQVTISGGAALLRSGESADSWKSRADRLLYSAKSAGRQQILVEREGSRRRNIPVEAC